MIRWDKKYATGDHTIDEQHKVLFSFVNDLEQSIKKKQYLYLDDILKYIEAYAAGHFDYEEECMTVRKCPFAAKNKTSHEKFLKHIHYFQQRYNDEGESTELIVEIYHMCARWLDSHICNIDVHLRDCPRVKK